MVSTWTCETAVQDNEKKRRKLIGGMGLLIDISCHRMVFDLLRRTMLTYGSAEDEVATLEPHQIKDETDKNFCDLCVNHMAFGVEGCRAEFYTNDRLKKCGITVGDDKSK
ncbi:hypothetical protein GUITHDRAFT_112081 [Guillardia theta CCMP2712]|uniref:Uncharacterized protein n=1 Tax=Guillardia theta (strain CCMP2712) TaxID=905079 RepID=L1J1I3_GUITC|nr:hypothetical protein GUITHDRAFT_112081 [Guillardia theta CCMP2712]EKX41945.1 hypothetical protein GUITHDRAFT_112081 [Guillardia theta CCMP2712]|eukprot:XP_005828925.1 hypothetical protein GUITHDRAFT_112081 [Guillardia theta CCMP2712]